MNARPLLVLTIALSLFLTACIQKHVVRLDRGADRVKIYKSDPPEEFEYIDEVKVVSGEGCGAFGLVGTYDSARNMLRNRTLKMGGTAARIDEITEPYLDPGGSCRHNEYIIRASIYRLKEE